MKVNKFLPLFLATLIVTSGVTVVTPAMTAQPAQAAVTQSQVNAAVNKILKETNSHRVKAGLKPLTLAVPLNTVAQKWTKKMGDSNFLSHNPYYYDEYPKGAGWGGENVARGSSYNTVVSGWMNSPGHKANILTKEYTHIGIGYYVDSKGGTWFTQNFAEYETVKAPPKIQNFDSSSWKSGFTAYWWGNDSINSDYKVDVYNDTSLVKSTIVKDPEVIVDGLVGNTKYTVKITARNTDPLSKKVFLSSVYSTTIKTDPIGIDPESEPVSATEPVRYLSADVSETAGEVGIMWEDPNDYSGYLMYYIVTLKSAGQADRVIRTQQNGLDLTGLKPGATYSANIQATIVGYDGQVTRLTPNKSVNFKVPNDPRLVKVSNVRNLKTSAISDTKMTASWLAPIGTVGKVDRYTVLVNQGNKTVKNFTTKSTSYKFSGLKPGTQYTVHVIAHARSGDRINEAISKVTTAKFSTTKVTVAKAAKPKTKVSTTPANVTATWTKPAITGKLVNYTVTLKQGKKVIKNISTKGHKASFSKLKENTSYSIQVKANVVSANNKNKSSATTITTVKTKLSAASTVKVKVPTALKVSAARTSVTASWKQPAVTGKVQGYTVVVKQGKKTVKTITTKNRKVTIKGLKAKTAYTFNVKANASSSNGKYKVSSSYSVKSIKTKR